MYLISLSYDTYDICILLTLVLIIAFVIICLILYVYIVNATQLHYLWFNSSFWKKLSIISCVLLKRHLLELSDLSKSSGCFWPSEQIILWVWFTAMTPWLLTSECPGFPAHLRCLLPAVSSAFHFSLCYFVFSFYCYSLCIFPKATVTWKQSLSHSVLRNLFPLCFHG